MQIKKCFFDKPGTLLPILLTAGIALCGMYASAAELPEKEAAVMINKANLLISEGIASKKYSRYFAAADLLDSAAGKTRYFGESKKSILALAAVGYAYARMKNEYTSYGFAAYQWDRKRVAKGSKGEWDSVSEAAQVLKKAGVIVKDLPDALKADSNIIIALGYDALRQLTSIDAKEVNRDSLYKEALGFFKAASVNKKYLDVFESYAKLDPWDKKGILKSAQLEQLLKVLIGDLRAETDIENIWSSIQSMKF